MTVAKMKEVAKMKVAKMKSITGSTALAECRYRTTSFHSSESPLKHAASISPGSDDGMIVLADWSVLKHLISLAGSRLGGKSMLAWSSRFPRLIA